MSTTVPKRHLTVEEYLAVEQTADCKSEFYDGEIFAMAGSSPAHSRIAINIGGELRTRLRGSICSPYDAGLHVHVPATGLYTYPDVSVVCGALEYLSGSRVVVVNPSLIVEILSPSTQTYDRGTKFFHYQSIKSLRDYLLVAQDALRVEHFFRQTDDTGSSQWLYTVYHGLDAVLKLPSLGVVIPLSEIYEMVELSPPTDDFAEDDIPHPGHPPF